MNLIAQVKLQTTPDQVIALKRTLETANAACGYISELAWENHCFKRYELQKRFYQKTRQKFPGLSSQVVIRCIAKVTDAYKLDRKTKRAFKPQGSISYDQRILSWRTKQDEPVVSIWSLEGRLKILAAFGPRQKEMIEQGLRGAANLIYRDGAFYLHQVCEVEEPDPDDPEGWLGIDLGIVNLATTSNGDTFSGKELDARRQWYEKRRAILQSGRHKVRQACTHKALRAVRTLPETHQPLYQQGSRRGCETHLLRDRSRRFEWYPQEGKSSARTANPTSQLGFPPARAVRDLQSTAGWCSCSHG